MASDESSSAPPDPAGERLAELLDPARIDALLADGIAIVGPDGLINRMIKAVLERGLGVEMADHLGYDRGDPAGQGTGNSRNGFTSKTVITSAGQAEIVVPRDRNGTLRAAAGAEAETPPRVDQRHDLESVCPAA